MLAPRELPPEYAAWNRRHAAPLGPAWWRRLLRSRLWPLAVSLRRRPPPALVRALGPFAFQDNSLARAFEYPWCAEVLAVRPGMRVLEVGAGASGLQWVLARGGAHVTSVDPLVPAPDGHDWTVTPAALRRLDRALGGGVRFVHDDLPGARLPSQGFDRIACISVVEHLAPADAAALMAEVGRLLAPGGRAAFTVDLFLGCAPFTPAPRCRWGHNVDVKALVDRSGLALTLGETSELLGHPDFDAGRVLSHLRHERLCLADVMTQCLVLERPAR